MQIVNTLDLEFTELRKNSPLKDADWKINFLRSVYKLIRLLFCSFSYYFMPFMAITLNMKYMVS